MLWSIRVVIVVLVLLVHDMKFWQGGDYLGNWRLLRINESPLVEFFPCSTSVPQWTPCKPGKQKAGIKTPCKPVYKKKTTLRAGSHVDLPSLLPSSPRKPCSSPTWPLRNASSSTRRWRDPSSWAIFLVSSNRCSCSCRCSCLWFDQQMSQQLIMLSTVVLFLILGLISLSLCSDRLFFFRFRSLIFPSMGMEQRL